MVALTVIAAVGIDQRVADASRKAPVAGSMSEASAPDIDHLGDKHMVGT